MWENTVPGIEFLIFRSGIGPLQLDVVLVIFCVWEFKVFWHWPSVEFFHVPHTPSSQIRQGPYWTSFLSSLHTAHSALLAAKPAVTNPISRNRQPRYRVFILFSSESDTRFDNSRRGSDVRILRPGLAVVHDLQERRKSVAGFDLKTNTTSTTPSCSGPIPAQGCIGIDILMCLTTKTS